MNGDGLCQCGCGVKTKIANRSSARQGVTKGEPLKFIKYHHMKGKSGAETSNWKGGKFKVKGYTMLKDGGPSSQKNGYTYEHILVAEEALGRPLPDGVVVHHVNGEESCNIGSNLVICQDQAYHLLLHKRARAYQATGNPNSRKCHYCKEWGTDLSEGKRDSFHGLCKRDYEKIRRTKKKEATDAK